MITIGNAGSGYVYNTVVPDLPRPTTPGVRPSHKPWCVDCKRTDRVLDVEQRCAQCARAVVTRAAAAERIAAESKATRVAAPPKPKKKARKPKRRTADRPRLVLPKDELIAAYQDGATSTVLADRYNTSRTTICNFLKANGVQLRGRSTQFVRTPELEEALRTAYVDDGLTIPEAGKRVGIGVSLAGKILHDLGVQMRLATPSKLSPTAREEIARRYAAGETSTDLAAAYDVTPSAITYVLRKQGVKTRRPGHRGSAQAVAS